MRLEGAWREAAKFAVVGVGATLIHVLVALGLQRLVALPALTANFLAYATAVSFSYLGNALWTFGRGAEDYAGPDSLWVRALSLYINIQQTELDRMAALDVLAGRLPRLEAPEAPAADRQLAWDIRDHLSSLSPDKPTAYLVNA